MYKNGNGKHRYFTVYIACNKYLRTSGTFKIQVKGKRFIPIERELELKTLNSQIL